MGGHALSLCRPQKAITEACSMHRMAGSAEEWLVWARTCRVGLRKSLGWDKLGRRYWALGGAAGAWRVYVEEDSGTRWGWYEGAAPALLAIAESVCLGGGGWLGLARLGRSCRL